MCDRVVSENNFMVACCPGKCKTERMCNKAVHDCLATLKFFQGWFVTSKILEHFDKSLLANDEIFFFNKDFNIVTFIANQRHIYAAGLDKINLDNENNFYEDDPDTIIHVRLLACCSKCKKQKALRNR